MRLIDLDDHIYCGEDGNYERYNIDPNIPTIDAVPVVRCKDCMWYTIARLKKDGTDDLRCKRSYCILWDNYFKPDYFCASADRREK